MNQSEFETIALILREKALATARRISPTDEDAQDTASDVMLRLWTLRHQLKDAAHALKLATIISHNISIDRIRTHRQTLTLTTDQYPTPQLTTNHPPDPSQELELAEDERWLLRQIEKLPPREQQVLTMRQIEQHSNQDIARLLGISEASVKVMLSNARKKLFNDIKKRYRQ